MKVKALFTTLATRAGINVTDAKFTALVDALPDLEADDEVIATPITTNLITEAEAEAKPTIKSKFTAQALNGIDAQLDAVLGDIFDPAELETFKTDNKATTKKLAKLLARAKELKGSAKPADQSELTRTIEKLNDQLATIKTTNEETISKLNKQHEEDRYYDKLANKVVRRADVVDYAKAKDGVRVLNDFKDTLKAVGGVLDIATGKIMQASDPTQPLFVDHKAVTADSVLEQTLKENEYLKVSEVVPEGQVKVPGSQGGSGGNQVPMSNSQRMTLERLKDS